MAQRFTLFLVFVLLFSGVSFAQGVATAGKIAGTVTDQETGEPLIGANIVVVEDTRLGAASNIEGEYYILNVPVGVYSVRASFVGYRDVTIHNVRVSANLTTQVKFQMPSEAIITEEVVVTVERPLIRPDITNSTRVVTADEFKNLPVRGFEEVAAVQTGVVMGRGVGNNVFFTRGGRAEETVIYVDGFEQNNLLTGQASVTVNNNAIEEVQTQTGGYNAEFGRAMSGIINVVTRGAAPQYSLTTEAETDIFLGDEGRGYNVYNAALSGPVVPGYKDLTLFLSGELRNLATRRATPAKIGKINLNYQGAVSLTDWDKGWLPHDRRDGYTLQGKLTFRPMPSVKFNANLLLSRDDDQFYFDFYKYNLAHAPVSRDKNSTLAGLATVTLDKSTYFEVGGAWFQTKHWEGDGYFGFDEEDEDGDSYWQTVVSRLRGLPAGTSINFRNAQDYILSGNIPLDNPPYFYDPAKGGFYVPDFNNLTAEDSLHFSSGDRFDPYGLFWAPGYIRRSYIKYNASYIDLKGNLVSQLTAHHQFKAGFEYRRHTLRYYENFQMELGSTANILNAYGYALDGTKNDDGAGGLLDKVRHPWDLAVYVQDKIELEGLVVNVGLRYDFFNANTKALKDPFDPLGANQVPPGDPRGIQADASDFADTKTEDQFSPRIGISFPVSDRTVLRFNYGKFFQQPVLTDLYYGTHLIEFKARNGSPTYSTQNPNLKPLATTAYEAGFAQQIADNVRFDVTAYYKDTKNLVNMKYTRTTAAGGAALYLLTNLDYGTVKGIDFALEARRVGHVSGRVAYSLSFSEGTGSISRENFNANWLGYETAKFTQPLQFDQRHTLSANIDIRNQKREGPPLLENAGVNVLILVRSGFPYTPTEPFSTTRHNLGSVSVPKDIPIDAVNSRYGPWTLRLDLKVNKVVDWGPFSTDIYLRVLNLLNTSNALSVYQATGDVNDDGYLGTADAANDLLLYETDGKAATSAADYIQKYHERLGGAQGNINGNAVSRFDIPRSVRLGVIVEF